MLISRGKLEGMRDLMQDGCFSDSLREFDFGDSGRKRLGSVVSSCSSRYFTGYSAGFQANSGWRVARDYRKCSGNCVCRAGEPKSSARNGRKSGFRGSFRKQRFSEVEPRQDLCYPFPLPRTEGEASHDGWQGMLAITCSLDVVCVGVLPMPRPRWSGCREHR